MAAPQEVLSFVHKFLNLCRNGESANLSLQCDHGKVAINLQLHLRQCPPPPLHPHRQPRQHPRPFQQPSPSRLRRSARRAHAHAQNEKVTKTEKVKPFANNNDTMASADKTEQVDDTSFSQRIKRAEEAPLYDMKVESENVLPYVCQASATDFPEHIVAEQAVSTIAKPENQQNSGSIQPNTTEEAHNEKIQNHKADAHDDLNRIMDVMEELKNNFTLDLRQTVRQSVQLGVQEAFKPP